MKLELEFRDWLRKTYGVQDYEAYRNTQTEEIAIRYSEYKTEQLQQHGISGKRPTEFSTEAVIDAIKTLWLKEYGNLNGNENERDGYFVCGFVHEALKAAGVCGAVDKTT